MNDTMQGIIYEMSESLSGINKLLSALNPSKLTAKEKQSLEISKRQSQRLERLIQELKDSSPQIEPESKGACLYRVEQVLLIHKESGLLLGHIATDHFNDPDLVLRDANCYNELHNQFI